jgi:hypothetical protein
MPVPKVQQRPELPGQNGTVEIHNSAILSACTLTSTEKTVAGFLLRFNVQWLRQEVYATPGMRDERACNPPAQQRQAVVSTQIHPRLELHEGLPIFSTAS